MDSSGQGAASNYMETHAEVLPIRHSADSVRSRYHQIYSFRLLAGTHPQSKKYSKIYLGRVVVA